MRFILLLFVVATTMLIVCSTYVTADPDNCVPPGGSCFKRGAAKFVSLNGELKPSTIQASHITFEKTSEHMVFLSNCVLSFHKHGMQGKSLATQQVTAEVADGSKVFHLLGSHGTIVIETRPADEPTSPSNIYILVSEDTA